jgi:hypothetical protein
MESSVLKYGFKKIGAGAGAVVVPDDGEQAVIADVKNLHASGCAYREISELLTARGVYSRTGKPFTADQIWWIVRDVPRARLSPSCEVCIIRSPP